MLDTIEFILKIGFIVLTIVWMGKMMILRSDKQIVINPLLIGISAILVISPEDTHSTSLTVQKIRIALYGIYCLIILFGVYSTAKDKDVF